MKTSQRVVGVASTSGRTKPITKRGNERCDWFILLLLLPTPKIWFSLDRKRRSHKRSGNNGNALILPTPIPSLLRLRLQFLLLLLLLGEENYWKE